jgi:hypothetical protein
MYGAIQILFHLKPLIDAGIVSVSNPVRAFCNVHTPDLVRSGSLQGLRAALQSRFSADIQMAFDPANQLATIDGPSNLIEHRMKVFPGHPKARDLARSLAEEGSTSVPDELRRTFINDLINPIVHDILQQHVHSSWYGMRYLTDREIDFQALEDISDSVVQCQHKAVHSALSHAVPTLEQLPLTELLRLRRNEGEAFALYRDAMNRTLVSLPNEESSRASEVFQDLVQPELNKIDALVVHRQQRLRRSAATDLLIGFGVVGVGLFSGLLTADAGKLIAELGGVGFGVNALRRAVELETEPEEARNSEYYFLWKARQRASKYVGKS